MVICSCGKSLDKVPAWLEGVQVEFVCNNCPNRDVKSIADIQLGPVEVEKKEDQMIAEMEDLGEEDDD